MKDKLDVVIKKLQSYSFILFIGLLVIAFVIVFAISQIRQRTRDESSTEDTSVLNPDPDDVTNILEETFIIPVQSDVKYEVARDYWDPTLPQEELLKTIIKNENRYEQNRGINYRAIDKSTFKVVAAATGKVVRVDEDDRLGIIVEIEHVDDLRTRYYSLSESKVSVGDTVKQGDVIGLSGTNYDTESGNHVHFEILKGEARLNPKNMIGHKLKEFVNTDNED